MSKKNNILLSIGLYSRKKQKNLIRCLDALEPIMNTVSCQLVITDIESKNTTAEIAQKYTDEVDFFNWCDDSIADRNCGIEKAKANWFMFIDADEDQAIQGISDMILFFKSEEYKDYMNCKRENNAWDMELYVLLADYYFKLQRYEDTIKYCDKYLMESKRDDDDVKLEKGLTYIAESLKCKNENTKNIMQILKGNCFVKQNNYEKAEKQLQLVEIGNLEENIIADFVKTSFLIATYERKWDILPKIYSKILFNAGEEAKRAFEGTLEICILNNTKTLIIIANNFAEAKDLKNIKDNDYVLLQKLRASMGGAEHITEEIVSCFMENHQDKAIELVYADFMIFALTSDKYAEKTVANIEVDDIPLYTKKITTIYDNLADVLINLINSRKNIIKLRSLTYDYWLLCLMEIIILSSEIKEDKLKKLTYLYIDLGYSYMNRLYSNYVFSDSNISILPRSYRFIYFTQKALNSLKIGDKIEYVNFLRKSVISYPIMLNVVQLLLDSMDDEMEENRLGKISNSIEFELYAKNIKSKIIEIENNGKHEEALELLGEYKKINSRDKEGIVELEAIIKN